jgi:hypothetical protein
MTNESIILVENDNVFSPVSEVHYSFYEDSNQLLNELVEPHNIQCIVGENHIPFGATQTPGLFDYADGVDTMEFLLSL